MLDEEPDNQKAKVLNLLARAQLKEGSEYLENQKEALSRLWEGFRGKVVTFYETEPTKFVKKVRRYHTDRTYCLHIERVLGFVSFVREEGVGGGAFKANSNSWRHRGHPDGKETKSKWFSDCPLSSICLRNLAIRSTLITQIW